MTALHACLACGRHPDTHAPADPDTGDACPMCGLGDAFDCVYCGDTGRILDGDTERPCGSCYEPPETP